MAFLQHVRELFQSKRAIDVAAVDARPVIWVAQNPSFSSPELLVQKNAAGNVATNIQEVYDVAAKVFFGKEEESERKEKGETEQTR